MMRPASDIAAEADQRGMRRALVVTALSLETKAVLAHLPESLGSCVARDGSVLEAGRLEGTGSTWLVVVAQSGAGTHQAQMAVTYALAEFGPVEVILFVGVAASRKAEAPIGSVVAANHLYFPYTGKQTSEGFSSRPHPLPVGNRLVGLATKVERDGNWVDRIRPPLRGKRPADADYPEPFPPAAFVAPIVSVESVSADPDSELERLISLHYGDSLALEMEGYGAMLAASREETPCTVIRGISDMRKGKDPLSDAVHQPVAAMHAAAFAFEVLDLWGQSYPSSRPSPARATQEISPSPPSAPVVTPELPPPLTTQEQVRLVLNFAGTQEDFPPQRCQEIVEALRGITGNPAIELVETQGGSFYMFLHAPNAEVATFDTPEVRTLLLDKFGAELISVMLHDDFSKARTSADALVDASKGLLDWPRTLPGGTELPRPELDQLAQTIKGHEGTTTAVLGPPGSGKSALLASFGLLLAERKVPFLAIKADQLDPNTDTEDALGRDLGLDALPSRLLLDLSMLRPAVLIIDQLDALASYVDLRTGRLSVLLNLVRRLGGRRNVHVVLSARTFEYEHDTRLKSVRAESLSLTLPPWSSVLQVLEARDIKAAGWPSDAQELLRSPQALATFLSLSQQAQTSPFKTYQAVLDELWRERILRLPNGGSVAALAGTIAEDMAERETLWLPAARYDSRASELEILVASGILTQVAGPGSIGFSHQTVFEHALARAFSQQEGRLSTYVLERESSLFIRPKLWAALTYLRAVDPAGYLSEFSSIFASRDLRKHLKHLLVEFLGQQTSPTDPEALLFTEALNSEFRRAALQASIGSAGWFGRLKGTAIPSAMSSASESGVAATILNRAWSFAPDDVVALLKSAWLERADQDHLLWMVLQDAMTWNQEMVSIAKRVIDRVDISPYAFEHTVATVGVAQPEIALELLAARLDSHVKRAQQEARRRSTLEKPADEAEQVTWYMGSSPAKPFEQVLEEADGWDSLEALAKSVPKDFLATVWPRFVEVLRGMRQYTEEGDGPGFSLSYALDFRFDDENSLGLDEKPILGALRVALETLASEDEQTFLAWIAENEAVDATPAQRLFAHALASQPERYAQRSLKFLLDDYNRFYLGNIEDLSGTTNRLIAAVSPFWTAEELETFSATVLAYSPPVPSDRDARGRQRFGQGTRRLKLDLLSSLPMDRISPNVRSFIGEQQRRFPSSRRGVEFSGAQFIGSPISAKELALASDKDVINAFKELPDATAWDHPKRWMSGGNIQLSREFAEFAKTDPERSARLVKQFEPSFGTRAAAHAIEAMAESAEPSLVLELISDLSTRGFYGEEFRSAAARAVEKLIDRKVKIDDDVIGILGGWLGGADAAEGEDTSDGDAISEDEDLAQPEKAEPTDQKDRHDSVLWGLGGFSILPHGNYPILETLCRLYLQREEPDRLLATLKAHLDRNDDQRVWNSLLRFFHYIRPRNPDDLGTFIQQLFACYPTLVHTREAAMMLAHLQWRLPDLAAALLSTWHSDLPRVQQAYGELVGLVALVQPSLAWAQDRLSEIVTTPSLTKARVGLAYAAVNVWSDTDTPRAASDLLQRLIPIADSETWSAIFDLFRLVDEITPISEWTSLLEEIVKHLAEAKDQPTTFVVDRLQTLLPHEAVLVGRMARGLVANWRDQLADLRTGTSSSAPDLVDIAVTLHRLGPQTRELGTSLFEDLLDINAYTARETLDQIDNRFRSSAPSTRRLPRRTRRQRKRLAAT